MGVVAEEAKHDQVGVEAVKTVTHIWVVVGLCFCVADILHNLVLSLAGDIVSRENDLAALASQCLP